MTWRRDDIQLGMLFTEDDLSSDNPLIYRVVGLVDEPMVILVPADERNGEDREYHVISSLNFSAFKRVELRSDTDAVQFGVPL